MVRHMDDFFGNAMFVSDEVLNGAVDRWAKAHFGAHVEGRVYFSDEERLQVYLANLVPEDYEKYIRAFELYNVGGYYKPKSEYKFKQDSADFLPAGITAHLLTDILGDLGLRPYGRTMEAGDGIFFQDARYSMFRLGRFLHDVDDFRSDGELNVNELVTRLAYLVGKMEAQKEIEPVEMDDLFGVIGDVMDGCERALFEYCLNSSETKPFQVEDVARTVLLERFGVKQLDDVLTDAQKRSGAARESTVELCEKVPLGRE